MIGVSKHLDQDLPAAHGALHDVDGISRLMTEQLGVSPANIVVLTNEEATKEGIGIAFAKLLQQAEDHPALFYFAGNGSLTSDGQPTILPYDARQAPIPNEILLSDLARQAMQHNTNLVSVIDAAWAPGDKLPWGAPSHTRFVPADQRPRPATRAFRIVDEPRPEFEWKPDPDWVRVRQQTEEAVKALRIGRATLYPASIQAAFTITSLPPGVAVAEAEFPSPFGDRTPKLRGALTTGLIQAVVEVLSDRRTRSERPAVDAQTQLANAETAITYADLLASVEQKLKWLQPVFVGARASERLFSNLVQEEQVQALIRSQVIDAPLRQTEELLKRLLERRNGQGMEAWLNLGIVHAAQNNLNKSIDALETAVKQGERGDPELLYEARYHLGRVLTLLALAPASSSRPPGNSEQRAGDLDRAASELRAATKGDPDNAAAHYFLGLAIRTRVEQEQLVEAERAWQTYLDLGAPLGHKDQVQEFIEARHSFGLGTGSGWSAAPAAAGTGGPAS